MECDVVGWPHFKEIAMKYGSIHGIVAKLKASEQLAGQQPFLQIGHQGSTLKAG
jgi:cytochrome c551/c552